MENNNTYFELHNLSSGKVLLEFKNKSRAFDLEFIKKFTVTIDHILGLDNIKGIILFGLFPTFVDVNTLKSLNKDARFILSFAKNIHDTFRSIETSEIPFIATTKESLVGPGLEIALACHQIICTANVQLYFPEISKGLMTISGATQRLSRTVGIKSSIEMLIKEKKITANEALNSKMISKISKNPLESAKKLLSEKINIIKPWDEKKYKSITADVWSNETKYTFLIENALTHAKFKSNYPAPKAILSSLFEGQITSFEAALSIERRWLTWLLCNKNTNFMLNYFETLAKLKNNNENFDDKYKNFKKSYFIKALLISYANEGNKLLEEGVSPILVDNSALLAGFAKGPLEVSDLIGTKDSGILGEKINRLGRKGISNFKGFYNYKNSNDKELWHEITDMVNVSINQPEVDIIKMRLLKSIAIETKKLLNNDSSLDLNLANHIAIKEKIFPLWTGGPVNFLQNIEQLN